MNRTLVTLTGPSCAGKTHLEEMLIFRGAARVVSNTSRTPRPGEVDGVHYRFRTRDWFEDQRAFGNLIECVEFGGNYYGNSEDDVLATLERGHGFAVWVIEPYGHKQVKRWAETASVADDLRHFSVFIDGDIEVIANRFLVRFMTSSDSPVRAARRLAEIMTTERAWVAEAHQDMLTGHELYDLYVEQFGPHNDTTVADWIEALVRNDASHGLNGYLGMHMLKAA